MKKFFRHETIVKKDTSAKLAKIDVQQKDLQRSIKKLVLQLKAVCRLQLSVSIK